MPFENGENWQPLAPGERGRYATFAAAVDAAFSGLSVQRSAFFDSLCDRWKVLFPNLPIRPGRWDDGKLFLYVPNAPTNFAMRSKLPLIKRTLAALADAPKRFDLRLEIHR